LETQIKTGVTGNGQPSRLTIVENCVTDLERGWWKLSGAAVVVWALINFGWEFVKVKLLGQ
jgi:hypothetical protein